MEFKHLSFNLLILFSFAIYTNASNSDCIYNIYVQTGDIPLAGTEANISIFLSDETKSELPILNLKDWGLTGSASNYFVPGKLDVFSGSSPCLPSTSICSLIIAIDGLDDWYCDFIEVTVVGLEKACSKKHFAVKKWLGNNRGAAVILQDECPSSDEDNLLSQKLL